jgi:hypothetical protein
MHEHLRGGKHSKGGPHTMVVGAKACWIYAWIPRYILYKKAPHFTQESPIEVMCLVAELTSLVIGQAQEDGDKRRQVFTKKPCLSMDNHFSGKHVDRFIGSNGYKGVYTTQRGRLQRGLKRCLHCVKHVEFFHC